MANERKLTGNKMMEEEKKGNFSNVTVSTFREKMLKEEKES
jgi:hypothetical protein